MNEIGIVITHRQKILHIILSRSIVVLKIYVYGNFLNSKPVLVFLPFVHFLHASGECHLQVESPISLLINLVPYQVSCYARKGRIPHLAFLYRYCHITGNVRYAIQCYLNQHRPSVYKYIRNGKQTLSVR